MVRSTPPTTHWYDALPQAADLRDISLTAGSPLADNQGEWIKKINNNLLNLRIVTLKIAAQYRSGPTQPEQHFESEASAQKALLAVVTELNKCLPQVFAPHIRNVEGIGPILDYNTKNAQENQGTFAALQNIGHIFKDGYDKDAHSLTALCDTVLMHADQNNMSLEEKAMKEALDALMKEWRVRKQEAQESGSIAKQIIALEPPFSFDHKTKLTDFLPGADKDITLWKDHHPSIQINSDYLKLFQNKYVEALQMAKAAKRPDSHVSFSEPIETPPDNRPIV